MSFPVDIFEALAEQLRDGAATRITVVTSNPDRLVFQLEAHGHSAEVIGFARVVRPVEAQESVDDGVTYRQRIGAMRIGNASDTHLDITVMSPVEVLGGRNPEVDEEQDWPAGVDLSGEAGGA